MSSKDISHQSRDTNLAPITEDEEQQQASTTNPDDLLNAQQQEDEEDEEDNEENYDDDDDECHRAVRSRRTRPSAGSNERTSGG
ncbi:unnamed protein product, partial [Rotaria magnacalcarata]